MVQRLLRCRILSLLPREKSWRSLASSNQVQPLCGKKFAPSNLQVCGLWLSFGIDSIDPCFVFYFHDSYAFIRKEKVQWQNQLRRLIYLKPPSMTFTALINPGNSAYGNWCKCIFIESKLMTRKGPRLTRSSRSIPT